ncbi:alpha/beta hydrolase [Allosphingosinicella vermicomposti]|uniref:alpha/beta hydrolase n=1 Tax=Allosphingosinicella vermicomposti TaxID=614671 RepID=UPI000D110986|nr:alpha/beta hydrolase [Allosphingosinicella vermicomposti]
MAVDRRTLLGGAIGAGVAAMSAASAAAAQGEWLGPTPALGDPSMPLWPARERYPLWPQGIPGAGATPPVYNPTMNGPAAARQLWVRGIAVPELHVYRPARPDGSALLSIPGGGYQFVSVQNEGMAVAQRFNASRTTVFVLAYRLPGEGWANRHVVPLQDAQRAMRIIRAHAADFAIDPKRLGVIGFSAGGHLAADLAVAHDEAVYAPVDDADRQSAKPAFVGLVYPVTTLVDFRLDEALLGPKPGAAAARARSPILRVDAKMPPCFLVHAIDDELVPLEHTTAMIAACRTAKVPVEAHIFSEGGHGFGLTLPDTMPGSAWPDAFARWMPRNGG